ncbi:MAG: hypothetical protein LBS76_03795 [Mycoplasmataceae bacterium]|jgi:hypothetical protein|nr:hypothetical protein [Mycoplasmataceae bacterium]
MKKMSQTAKKQTNGGIGPMMLWVLIMGVIMAIDTVSNIATSASEAGNSQNGSSSTKRSSYSASKRSNGYVRVSPFPARTAVMMNL